MSCPSEIAFRRQPFFLKQNLSGRPLPSRDILVPGMDHRALLLATAVWLLPFRQARAGCPGAYDCNRDGSVCAPKPELCAASATRAKAACAASGVDCDASKGSASYRDKLASALNGLDGPGGSDGAAKDATAALKDAGLDPGKLQKDGWTPKTTQQLARGIGESSKAVEQLHLEHPSATADAYRDSAISPLTGTLTNIEDSAKKAVGAGDFERGCLSHQAAVYDAVSNAGLDGVEARKIMIGGVMEHHAVVLTPRGQDWRTAGVVIDPWPLQSSTASQMVFPIDAWRSKFGALGLLGRPRLEN